MNVARAFAWLGIAISDPSMARLLGACKGVRVVFPYEQDHHPEWGHVYALVPDVVTGRWRPL